MPTPPPLGLVPATLSVPLHCHALYHADHHFLCFVLVHCDDYTKILDDEHVGVGDKGDANDDGTRGDSGGGWNDED